MLTIGPASITAILEIATQIFQDLEVLLHLAIALPLGFWLVRKTISLVRVR